MICKLCLLNKKIINSHIIPEFFYKSLYDKVLHRFNVLSTDPRITRKYDQKGLREKLLCEDCEEKLSKNERYVNHIINGGVGVWVGDKGAFVEVTDIDYSKYKLCMLSILWRAGISSLPFFEDVKLGSKHSESLRKMIYNETPLQEDKYGFITFAILNRDNEILEDLIVKPQSIRLYGHRFYRFVFGGMGVFFQTSNHVIDKQIKDTYLKKEGKLLVYKVWGDQIEYLTEFAKDLKKYNKI